LEGAFGRRKEEGRRRKEEGGSFGESNVNAAETSSATNSPLTIRAVLPVRHECNARHEPRDAVDPTAEQNVHELVVRIQVQKISDSSQ
jgi:hypothetical protein